MFRRVLSEMHWHSPAAGSVGNGGVTVLGNCGRVGDAGGRAGSALSCPGRASRGASCACAAALRIRHTAIAPATAPTKAADKAERNRLMKVLVTMCRISSGKRSCAA